METVNHFYIKLNLSPKDSCSKEVRKWVHSNTMACLPLSMPCTQNPAGPRKGELTTSTEVLHEGSTQVDTKSRGCILSKLPCAGSCPKETCSSLRARLRSPGESGFPGQSLQWEEQDSDESKVRAGARNNTNPKLYTKVLWKTVRMLT